MTLDPIPGAIEHDLLFAGVRLVDRRFNIRIDDGDVTIRELGETATMAPGAVVSRNVSPPPITAEIPVTLPPPPRRKWPWSVARQKLARRRQH